MAERWARAALLAAFAATPGLAPAAERGDAARVREVLAAGTIRPLAEILAAVEARYLGRVIATELEEEGGVWIYEFKLLSPTGRVFEIEVDARTGAVRAATGPMQERR